MKYRLDSNMIFFYQSAIQYVASLYLRKTKQDNMLLSITLKRTWWLRSRKPLSLMVIVSRATLTHTGVQGPAHVSIRCHQVSNISSTMYALKTMSLDEMHILVGCVVLHSRGYLPGQWGHIFIVLQKENLRMPNSSRSTKINQQSLKQIL